MLTEIYYRYSSSGNDFSREYRTKIKCIKEKEKERERERNKQIFWFECCIVFKQEDRGTTRASNMELSFNKTQRRDKVADSTDAKIAQ